MNPKTTKPYDLCRNSNSTGKFYSKLAEFTDHFALSMHQQYGQLIREYTVFNRLHPNDALLDILITGVLYKEYGNQDRNNLIIKSSVLKLLYSLRKINSFFKRHSDIIRGKLAYYWLAKPQKGLNDYSLASIKKLIYFLTGTSEYSEEVKRIKEFKRYLNSLNKEKQLETVMQITQIANIFKQDASKSLKAYTTGVRQFWQENRNFYKGKENFFFCNRKPVVYHLNMVGAELMNRTLRPTYKSVKNKVILLPVCMSKKQNCQKKNIGNELICSNCSKDCQVNIISRKYDSPNTRTVLIPHSSKFSKYLKPWANQTETALIGVACVLNLLKGGFEMKRLNIPSQCVFLDFSGCQKHWISGEETKLNIQQLESVLFCNQRRNNNFISNPMKNEISSLELISLN